jgi:hypothetical protein
MGRQAVMSSAAGADAETRDRMPVPPALGGRSIAPAAIVFPRFLVIVSNKDPLTLEEYRGIRILPPDGFWRLEQQ